MKKILIVLLLFSTEAFPQRIKKTLFIIADGIPADVIESVPHPHLEKIAEAGSYSRAYVGGARNGYSQTPTISAVSYNSLLTGTWVNKHNVWGNDIKAPNYHYPTIFRLFKDQYPGRKIGIYSTWTDNRTKLIGENLPATKAIKMDFVSDGYELDTTQYPHDRESNYIHLIDERVATAAAQSIKEQAPDLSWVYLEYTDDMGHRYGNSAQQKKAVGFMDEQVGRIYDAIQYREKNFNEDWLILVTTDHGRDSVTGRDHGGQSTRERTTWIFSNKKLNAYAEQQAPAIVDILPTMAKHLAIDIPTPIRRELDGVSLLGNVAIASANTQVSGDSVIVTWKPLVKNGKVKILVSNTNQFKEGGVDEYAEAGVAQVSDGRFVLKGIKPVKIVLESELNTIGVWNK